MPPARSIVFIPLTASPPASVESPADSNARTDSHLSPRQTPRRAYAMLHRSSATASACHQERVPLSRPVKRSAGLAAAPAQRRVLDGQPAVCLAAVLARGSASILRAISRAVSSLGVCPAFYISPCTSKLTRIYLLS